MKTSKYGFDGCMLSLTVWFVNIPHCSALKRFVFHFLNSLLGMTWYWVALVISDTCSCVVDPLFFIKSRKWSTFPWSTCPSEVMLVLACLEICLKVFRQKFVCYEDSSGVPFNPVLVRQSNSLSLSPIHHHLSQYQSSTISISPILVTLGCQILACLEICLQVFRYKFVC